MNNTEDDGEVLQTFGSRMFWLTLFCPFSLISLFFFYFYFYHMYQQYQTLLYRKLNNHTLLCLLITDYLMIQTELPMTIGFLTRNRAIIETQSFCVYWNYWYYVWSTMSIQFSMLTAISRYLLIFHKAFLMKYKLYCHYLPMLCIWLYLPCLHLYFIAFFPYGNTTFDFSKEWCGGPQFIFITFYVTWDTLFDTFMPMAVMVVFNFIIIIKVFFFQNLPRGTATKWKKNRRMILQLTGICCSQLIGGVPYTIITLGETYGSATFALDIYTQALIYTFYIPSLCSPLFAMTTMPKEVRDKITLIFRCWKRTEQRILATSRRISVIAVNALRRDQLQSADRNEPNRTLNSNNFFKMQSNRITPELFLETLT